MRICCLVILRGGSVDSAAALFSIIKKKKHQKKRKWTKVKEQWFDNVEHKELTTGWITLKWQFGVNSAFFFFKVNSTAMICDYKTLKSRVIKVTNLSAEDQRGPFFYIISYFQGFSHPIAGVQDRNSDGNILTTHRGEDESWRHRQNTLNQLLAARSATKHCDLDTRWPGTFPQCRFASNTLPVRLSK